LSLKRTLNSWLRCSGPDAVEEGGRWLEREEVLERFRRALFCRVRSGWGPTLLCKICITEIFRGEIEEHADAHFSKIWKNINIIVKCRKAKGGRQFLRKIFAAYRLHRYHNVPPQLISKMLNIGTTSINTWIGRAFSILCLGSRECWARPMFEEEMFKRQRHRRSRGGYDETL